MHENSTATEPFQERRDLCYPVLPLKLTLQLLQKQKHTRKSNPVPALLMRSTHRVCSKRQRESGEGGRERRGGTEGEREGAGQREASRQPYLRL